MRKIPGILAAMLVLSCSRYGGDAPLPPALASLSAESEGNSVTLTARVERGESGGIQEAGFYLWLEKSRQIRLSGVLEGDVLRGSIGDLAYDATYQYVAFADNGRQEIRSEEARFHTGAAPPAASAPEILSSDAQPGFTSVQLSAALTGLEGVEACGFYLWEDESRWERLVCQRLSNPFSLTVEGLRAGTAYSACAFFSINGVDVRSSPIPFTTRDYPLPSFVQVDVVPGDYYARVQVQLDQADYVEACGVRMGGVDYPCQLEGAGFGRGILGLKPETSYTLTPFYVQQGSTYLAQPVTLRTEASPLDPVFWAWLLQKYDIDQDGILSQEEKAMVGEIARDWRETPYTSLEGLSQFPNLQRLYVSDCPEVTGVDLSGNPRLEILEMNHVGVRAFDLSGNPVLRSLSLGRDDLEALDLQYNPELVSIWVSENRLQALDVSMLPRLEQLECVDNPLTTLDLRQNPRLSILRTVNCPSLQFIYLHPDAALVRLEVDPHTLVVK